MTLLWQRYDDACWRDIAALGLVPGVPRGAAVEPVDGVDDWRDQCAVALLVSLMGDARVQERIVEFETCDASKDYLALGSHVSQIAVRRFRIRELARRLYELQSFPW